MDSPSIAPLWAASVDRLKDRINNRSLWEALEHTCPIGIEGNTLIIGIEPDNFNYATHIQQNTLQHKIQEVISQIFRQPLQLKLIEGTTWADWEAFKALDARLTELKRQAPVTAVQPTHSVEIARSGSWDALYENLSQLYSQTPFRTLPQGRARFANEALYLLVETMDTLYPENADESIERALTRIIERVSTLSEMPAVILAFELERLRAWRKASEG